ncbi:TPA: pyridoxal-phosphate dependent enzyme [Candidatus Micrarchaeota archaeon]|nr:pyridoxal-phosphate dependent enzyme [Candidatus Micrarchaeota archaeon]
MASREGRAPQAELICIECGARFGPEVVLYKCPRCGSLLEVVIDIEAAKSASWSLFASRAPGVWRYREFLPADSERAVTLGEGATPLIRAERLAERLGLRELYLKFEGANPTGSFKDRGIKLA